VRSPQERLDLVLSQKGDEVRIDAMSFYKSPFLEVFKEFSDMVYSVRLFW
jgi:hypothetical protein